MLQRNVGNVKPRLRNLEAIVRERSGMVTWVVGAVTLIGDQVEVTGSVEWLEVLSEVAKI